MFYIIVIEKPTIPATTSVPTQNNKSQEFIKSMNRSYYPTLLYNTRCDMYPQPFYSEKWQESFNKSVDCFASKNPNELPFEPKKHSPLEEYISLLLLNHSTPYTRHFIHEENGIVWVFASNVCFDFRRQVCEVFAEPQGSRGLMNRVQNFQWRWEFKYTNNPIPTNSKDYPTIDEEGSWMIIPGWVKHTSHLAQNAIMISYHLHHREILPPVYCLLILVNN